jgi:hypothetical protein
VFYVAHPICSIRRNRERWETLSQIADSREQNMETNNASKALRLVQWLSDQAIDGVRPLSSAHDLADEYLLDQGYKSHGARVDALINWETTKNFTSGFITGLGGVLILPISLPTAVAASWLIQARMAAAIARIYGHDLKSESVRAFMVAALVGDSVADIAKASGIVLGRGVATTLANRALPGKALLAINKRVGLRLLMNAGNRGGTTVVRGVPFVGGIVGGAFDALACRMAGRSAKALFAKPERARAKKPPPPRLRRAKEDRGAGRKKAARKTAKASKSGSGAKSKAARKVSRRSPKA